MDSLKVYSLIGLGVYFLILIIVVLRDRSSENAEEYFFANKKLPFWMLSITFIASWWGAGSALSTADMAYTDGIGAFWYYGVPVLLSTFLMIIFSKMIRRVGSLTQGEMVGERYDRRCTLLVAIMILIFMVLATASQMVGIGDFFGTYLGVEYNLAIIIGTSIVFIYSLFGGFKGVVLTDIIQFIFLAIANIIIFLVALGNAGGFGEISTVAINSGKSEYFSFFSGMSKYLPYVITFGASWMIQANVWQRISATKNARDAKRMTVMSFFLYIPLYLLIVFTGMAGIVLFKEFPEGGIVSGIINSYMSPALGSVMFIGLSSAIMSTMDSLINTGSMTLTIDIYKGFINREVSSKKLFKISRYSTGIVTIIAFIIATRIKSILDISWLASDIITTGVFIPLILGFLWKRGNSNGAFSSMIFGIGFSIYNLLGTLGINLPRFWQLGSVEQIVLGVGMSFIIYVFVSLITKPEYEKSSKFIERSRGGRD